MADKMWDLLQYFKKKPDGAEIPTDAAAQAKNDQQELNAQLMATLENTEKAIDAMAAGEMTHDDVHSGMPLPTDDLAAEVLHSEEPDVPEPTPAASPAEPAEAEEPPSEETEPLRGASGFLKISVARIKPNPYQPRKVMGENEITELSQSIKELGVLQPILVRQIGDAYELVAGERRLRASQRAGLSEIPAIVIDTQPLTQQIMALVENIQRKNLSAIEEAVCLQDIIAKTGWSQVELSRRTGRSQASIANKLRLLRLDQSVQDLVIAGKLGERQARSLLSLSVDEQRLLAQKAVDEDLSARALEALAENWNESQNSGGKRSRGSDDRPDGPGGALLGDLAAMINKHRNKGVLAQWKVKQMDNTRLVVEISVDLSGDDDDSPEKAEE